MNQIQRSYFSTWLTVVKCFYLLYWSLKFEWTCVVLLGTRFCRFWPKRCFFHEFLWFWQFFTNFSYFSSFAVILCVSVTNLSLALRFSSNSCAHHKNYGKWWKIGEIREKLSKSKKFVKKTPFSSKLAKSSPEQYNNQCLVYYKY